MAQTAKGTRFVVAIGEADSDTDAFLVINYSRSPEGEVDVKALFLPEHSDDWAWGIADAQVALQAAIDELQKQGF